MASRNSRYRLRLGSVQTENKKETVPVSKIFQNQRIRQKMTDRVKRKCWDNTHILIGNGINIPAA